MTGSANHDRRSTGLDHHQRRIVWIVAACVFASVVNTTMVNVALPSIGNAFDANEARLGWLVTIYSLTFGIGTPFYGRLGDRYGLRRMFVVGLCVFVASSLVAGVAVSFGMLLLGRAMQAAGSAAIPSLGTAMIARSVPAERRGQALGVISMAVGAGSALGPTLGGALTEFGSWRLVFLVSVALALVIPPSVRALPRSAPDQPSGPVDWLGGVALGATIAGVMLAISGAQRQGVGSTFTLVALVVAVIGMIATVLRQRSSQRPFVDRLLLANRRYLVLCLVGFCAMAGNVGAFVMLPFLLEEVHDLSPGQIGLSLLPSAVAIALLSRPVGGLADRVNPLRLVATGCAMTVATLLSVGTLGLTLTVVPFAALTTLVGVGQALTNSPLSVALTTTLPPRVYGAGLGVFNMMFFVGAGFGAAVSTATLSSRRGAQDALLPEWLSPSEHVAFSDAFLPSVALFALALALTLIANRLDDGGAENGERLSAG